MGLSYPETGVPQIHCCDTLSPHFHHVLQDRCPQLGAKPSISGEAPAAEAGKVRERLDPSAKLSGQDQVDWDLEGLS